MKNRREWFKSGLKLAAVAALPLAILACGKKEEAKPAAAPAAAPVAAKADPLKVAFVYIGPVGDAGWTFAHDNGRKALEAEFGDKIKTTFVENVPEGPDSERVFRDLATQGNKLIFGTSFGYMDAMHKVAKDFPDTKFEHATGYKDAPNLALYEARFYEDSYLAGMMAGKTTKSNKLGVVASFPIPEVIRNINAFTLGAKSTNPKATVRAVWISTWFDPAKEKEAALAMINQGVDVLIQNTDSSATLQAAQEKGVHAFGWDSDMSKFADKAHLASAVVNWAPYYKSRVKAVLDGSWKTAHTWWGMAQDTNELASINASVSEDLKKLVMEKKEAIKTGKFHPFSGPIKNQKGEEVVKAGATMSDDDMRKLNYYVQGVEGSLPASK